MRSNEVPAPKDTLKWVSCSKESDEHTARHRHLLRNVLDTLCNASASYPEVWRGNTRKPKCPICVKIERTGKI